MYRTRLIIDQHILRFNYINRNMDALHQLFPPGKVLEDLLRKSLEIAKNYIAMVALNFEFETEIHFERD